MAGGAILHPYFLNFYKGVSMMALSTTIEIDLREMLGEKDLPEKPNLLTGY